MTTPTAGARPVRRPRTGRLVLAGLALLPVAEIAVAVLVAGKIGVGWTLLALLALSVAGVVVLGRAGRAAVRTLGPRTVPGGLPADAGPRASRATGSDLALVGAGGVLLAVPGFLTALLGALLVLPTRRVVRPLLGAGAMRLLTSAARRGRVRVVAGETVERVDVRVTRIGDLDEPADGAAPRAILGEVVEPHREPPAAR